MRSRNRARTFGSTLAVLVLGAACSTQTRVGFAPTDGSADDADEVDAAADATSDVSTIDSTTPSGDGATQDVVTPANDAVADDTGSAAETGGGTDAAAETGVVEAGTPDANCSVGSGADYQATCTGCTISATCLLMCQSCTTDAQTQNADPTLQLPCAAGTSAQNTNGELTCS
jgi:hypothetical protein